MLYEAIDLLLTANWCLYILYVADVLCNIVPTECKIHTLWINVLSTHLWVYNVTVVNIDVVVRQDT